MKLSKHKISLRIHREGDKFNNLIFYVKTDLTASELLKNPLVIRNQAVMNLHMFDDIDQSLLIKLLSSLSSVDDETLLSNVTYIQLCEPEEPEVLHIHEEGAFRQEVSKLGEMIIIKTKFGDYHWEVKVNENQD